MKWFLELGNRYAKKSSWVDFAYTKICLFSMGILVGLCIPDRLKKKVSRIASVAFTATYAPLMLKVSKIAKEMPKQEAK